MLALVGCASTEFKNTWKAPNAAPLSVKPGDVVVTMVMSGERAASPDTPPMLANDCARAWNRCWDWVR